MLALSFAHVLRDSRKAVYVLLRVCSVGVQVEFLATAGAWVAAAAVLDLLVIGLLVFCSS